MAIRFKYDLATVAPPSNDLTRKFGQSLVLQQQQQKYSGQQAGYDRLFDAYKQQNQNAFQWNQAADNRVFQAKQQEAQNNFLTGRDKTQFDQRQQEAEAERQRAFLEEGRKQQSGYITDAIKNGEYDPATSRKLQQNLVAEAEALGNPQLDATQRAEVLAKIRAERATLTANRMERPPEPSDQEKFNKGIVVDPVTGMRYRANSKGDYEPLPPGEQQQPKSAVEAFKADPKTGDKYREKAEARLMGADDEMPQVDSGEVGEDGTKKKRDMTPQEFQKEAKKLAEELWNIDNMEESPTLAPDITSGAIPAVPQEASILEQSSPPAPGIPIAPPDPGQPPSPGPQKPSLPLSSNTTSQNPWAEASGAVQPTDTQAPPSAAEYDAEMTSKGYKLTTPADGGRPYYFKDFGSGPAQPGEAIPQAPTQGNASALPTVAPPDFGKLVGSATDDNEKAVISQIQGLVSQNADSPDIVNALHVFVSPGSSKEDRLAAFDYLSTAGIDLNQMIAEEPGRAEKIKGVQEKNKERFGSSRDLLNGM